MEDATLQAAASVPQGHLTVSMRLTRFELPPVNSALIMGRRASIGPHAMREALEEMLPQSFTLIPTEHPLVEAIIVRNAHLRRIAAEKLVPVLLTHAETLMDETEVLHVELSVDVHLTTRIDL